MDPTPPTSQPPSAPPPGFGPPPLPPSMPPRPPVPPPQQDIALWPVFRDIAIVFVLTFFGGCIVGAWRGMNAQTDQAGLVLAVALSNIVSGTIAFTISGVLAPSPRWRHLFFVGIGSWLLSLINVFAFGLPVHQWLFGVIPMAIMMGAGGGLSYMFKSDRPRY